MGYHFLKTTDELKRACGIKREKVVAKIEERKKRIIAMREEYKITDQILIDLLQQARKQTMDVRQSYSTSNMVKGSDGKFSEETFVIGAGVVNMLMTETDFIAGERQQIEKLTMIIGNLRDTPNERGNFFGHELSYAELEYLEF